MTAPTTFAELGLRAPIVTALAELTQAGDERHAQVLALYDSEPRLRVPRRIVSFGPGALGGTPAGNAAAAADSWPRILQFLRTGLAAR